MDDSESGPPPRTAEDKKYVQEQLDIPALRNVIKTLAGSPIKIDLDETVYRNVWLDSDNTINGEDFGSSRELVHVYINKVFKTVIQEVTPSKFLTKVDSILFKGTEDTEVSHKLNGKTVAITFNFYMSHSGNAPNPRNIAKWVGDITEAMGFAKENVMDGVPANGLLPLKTGIEELRKVLNKPKFEAFFDWNVVKDKNFKFPCAPSEFRDGVAEDDWLIPLIEICKQSEAARNGDKTMKYVTRVIIRYDMKNTCKQRNKGSWNLAKKAADNELVYEMDYEHFDDSLADPSQRYLAFAAFLDKTLYDAKVAEINASRSGGGGGSSGGGGGGSKSSGGGSSGPAMRKCPHCGGKGVMGMPKKTCSPCNGSGQLRA